MTNNKIGYIICEADAEPSEVKLSTKTINGKVVGEAVLQTADEKNRNGRYYAEEELFPQINAPRTQELLKAGYLRAECGHPMEKDLQRQSTINDTLTCARFLNIWTEGKDIKATFVGTNNEYGKAFDADLKEGCLPAWSLRALGSVENTRRGAEVKNLRIITWDNVIYPSHPHAYTTGLVQESVGIEESNQSMLSKLISTNEAVSRNILSNEAMMMSKNGIMIPYSNFDVAKTIVSNSRNIGLVKECFDFAYSGIVVSENGSRVYLTTNEGSTMVINMEEYIHNELMNYATESNIVKPKDEEKFSFLK